MAVRLGSSRVKSLILIDPTTMVGPPYANNRYVAVVKCLESTALATCMPANNIAETITQTIPTWGRLDILVVNCLHVPIVSKPMPIVILIYLVSRTALYTIRDSLRHAKSRNDSGCLNNEGFVNKFQDDMIW